MPGDMNRRSFVAGLAGLGASAALPSGVEAAPKKDSAPEISQLIDKMLKCNIKDSEGNKVTRTMLETFLKDKFVAVSVGFGECEMFCPRINEKHGAMAEAFKDSSRQFVSIVINTIPQEESTPEQRKAHQTKAKAAIKDRNHQVKVLFPETDEMVGDLQKFMNLAKTRSVHSPMITLYTPDGQYYGRKNGYEGHTDTQFKDWAAQAQSAYRQAHPPTQSP